MTLTLIQRLSAPTAIAVAATLPLSADERQRSRCRLDLPDGRAIALRLPRGTRLQAGDYLQATTGEIVQVTARPEPVLTATAATPHVLLRAAYHLGNRHVPLEIAPDYLRLAPDSVLQTMLQQLGVAVTAEIAPFQPEAGAYAERAHHHHSDPA